MNNNIECPKCSEVIENEKYDFIDNEDKLWYQFQTTKMLCPHCRTRLRYGSKSQSYIYFLGLVFLVTIILSLLNYLPIISIVFAPVLALFFWRYRKLCIY